MSEPLDFDLAASSLRADSADVPAFIEALAVRLQGALPQQVRVRRRARRPFSKDKQVESVEVAMSEYAYTLTLSGGRARGRRVKTVRGIAIKSEDFDLDAWLAALTAELALEAERSEASRQALQRLLG